MTLRSPWITLLVLLVGAGVFLAHALHFRAIFHGNALDDAYISFRYADHLAHGGGLSFNAGERVEGYSNFLWVLILAAFVRPCGDLTWPSQLLGLGFGLGSMGLAIYTLRRLYGVTHPLAAALVVLLLATSGYFAAWAVAGLEGTMYGFLLLAACVRYVSEQNAAARDRWPLSAFLVGAIALARPEGVFVALAAAAFHAGLSLRRLEPLGSRRTLLFPAIILGIVAGYEAWRFAYYGPYLLPNSVRAKIGGGVYQVARGAMLLLNNFLPAYAPLVVAPVLLGASWRRLEYLVMLGCFAGYLFFVIVVGGDWSHGRFFAPILPVAAVLGVAAVWQSAHVARMARGAAARAGLAMLAVAWLGGAFYFTNLKKEAETWHNYTDIDAERIAIGKWLARTVPGDAVLAVHAAGEVPYYSGLYTHDMLGLNDAHIASLQMPGMGRGVPGHEKYDPAYTMEKVRPDIIIDGRLVPGLRRHPLWRNDYQPVANFWKFHDVVMRRELLQRLAQIRADTSAAGPPAAK